MCAVLRHKETGPTDEKVAEGVFEIFQKILLDAPASVDSGVSTRLVRRVRRNIERLHLRRVRGGGGKNTRLADPARSQLTLTEATVGQVSQVNRPGSARVARETSEPRSWFLQSLLDMAAQGTRLTRSGRALGDSRLTSPGETELSENSTNNASFLREFRR